VVDDWPVRRSKHHALYAKEQAVEYRPGTAFLYSMDTLHRGTPVKDSGIPRIAHHLVIRRASAEWYAHSISIVVLQAHCRENICERVVCVLRKLFSQTTA
jgi:hypothetical protein